MAIRLEELELACRWRDRYPSRDRPPQVGSTWTTTPSWTLVRTRRQIVESPRPHSPERLDWPDRSIGRGSCNSVAGICMRVIAIAAVLEAS